MIRPLTALSIAALLTLTACGGAAASSTATSAAGDKAPPAGAAATTEAAPAPADNTAAAGSEVDKKTLMGLMAGGFSETKSYRMDISSVSTQSGKETKSVTVMLIDNRDPGNEKSSMTMTSDGMSTSTITIGNTSYMKMMGQEKWTKYTSTPGESSGDGPELPMPTENPIEAAGDGILKILYMGSELVNGAKAEHYQVFLDPKSMGSEGSTDPASYDIWLDAKGRSVKTSMTYTSSGIKVTTVSISSKFNEDQGINAPPADQVIEG